MLMSQPRIFFAMSRDQLLPAGVSKVHPRFRTPYITTIITCVIVAAVAGLVPIQILGEMTSIGTLFAFVVVSLAVIILRIRRPDARRPFRVAVGYTIPILGVLSCVYLMVSLSVMTWVRFLGWLDHRDGHLLVLRPHPQPAGRPGGSGGALRGRELRQFPEDRSATCCSSTVSASPCWPILTILDVTNETLAKWHELDDVLNVRRHAHQPADRRSVRPDDHRDWRDRHGCGVLSWQVVRAALSAARRRSEPARCGCRAARRGGSGGGCRWSCSSG